VRSIAPDVLRHRIGLTYEAEAQGVNQEEIVERLLATVKVP
jgi:MoxR-like ATPase